MHRFTVRVRYGDTDQMGWAYHANHLRWFEIGRSEMLRSLGRSYREMEDEVGVRLPVLEARCRYRQGARYDDELVIESAIASLGRASVTFAYRITRVADGALVATGTTEHCCLDRDGRPMRPPAELARLLAQAPRAPEGWERG